MKKTMGEKWLENYEKPESREDVSVIDLQREMLKKWPQRIQECIDDGKKKFESDFFIEIKLKKERLYGVMIERPDGYAEPHHGNIRSYFIVRRTCPLPTFDQTVYRFHRNTDTVEYLWCLPDFATYHRFMQYPLEVVPQEKDLLDHCIDYNERKYHLLADKLNEEIHEQRRIFKPGDTGSSGATTS